MYCGKCGYQLNKVNSKFCPNCGHELLGSNLQQRTNSYDQDPNLGICQICGLTAPVKYVEFYANIGMLITRQQKSIKGNLCRNCINKTFTRFTLINTFLGWWGVISFFATSFFMINNIFRYLTALSLKYRER
jgi:hypothetical protein